MNLCTWRRNARSFQKDPSGALPRLQRGWSPPHLTLQAASLDRVPLRGGEQSPHSPTSRGHFPGHRGRALWMTSCITFPGRPTSPRPDPALQRAAEDSSVCSCSPTPCASPGAARPWLTQPSASSLTGGRACQEPPRQGAPEEASLPPRLAPPFPAQFQKCAPAAGLPGVLGFPGPPAQTLGLPPLIEVTADSGFPRFAASQHGFLVSGCHSARKPACTQNQGAWERRPPSACRRQGTQARGLTQEACPGHRRSSRSPHPLSGSEGSTERPSPGSAASTGRGVSTTPDSAQARGLH